MTVEHEATRWAATMVGQLSAEPLPLFGSPQWVEAPGNVRLASCIRAALAWLNDRDPRVLAARFEQETEAARRYAERDYDQWREIAAKVRASAEWPSHAELQRRRAS